MRSHFQADYPRRRHKLLPEAAPQDQAGGITTIESLRDHLQTAIELEHATIPPYLCALYSIKDGSNSFAYQVIQSVVMEEMLHMILSANILNAIGGSPAINTPEFIPEYPTYLPHSDDAFIVPLQKFSRDSLHVFLQIEHAQARHAHAQADHYKTIGQFYMAIEQGLRRLDAATPGGIFTGEASRQVTPQHYYGGGGQVIPVRSLADAIQAIHEIVGQGEGANRSIEDTDHAMFGEEVEYAHYFRYNEIFAGRRYLPRDRPSQPPSGPPVDVDWEAAYDMQPNPKMSDYPTGSPLWTKTREFNQTYMALLGAIHQACNGQPEVLGQAIPLMYDLKYKALELMRTPNGKGKMAGPSFEYLE